MKLRLKPFNPPKPAPKCVTNPKEGYESPIGWWNVTTEGDCEGRSTRHLGTHYGHVAEIALSLPEEPCYSYRFQPVTDSMATSLRPGKRHVRKPVRDRVWVSFDSSSGLHSCKPLEAWLDAIESISCHETDGMSRFYNGTFLELKTSTPKS